MLFTEKSYCCILKHKHLSYCLLLPFVDALVHYNPTNGHSELVIERVSKDDSGTYTCAAENSVGTIKSLGFVYVKGKITLS